MSEGGQPIENQPNPDRYPDGDGGAENHRPRWLAGLLIATTLLVIMAVGAYLFYGRELFQRPFLVVAVLIAWLGALVGGTIGSEPGKEPQLDPLVEGNDRMVSWKGEG